MHACQWLISGAFLLFAFYGESASYLNPAFVGLSNLTSYLVLGISCLSCQRAGITGGPRDLNSGPLPLQHAL